MMKFRVYHVWDGFNLHYLVTQTPSSSYYRMPNLNTCYLFQVFPFCLKMLGKESDCELRIKLFAILLIQLQPSQFVNIITTIIFHCLQEYYFPSKPFLISTSTSIPLPRTLWAPLAEREPSKSLCRCRSHFSLTLPYVATRYVSRPC